MDSAAAKQFLISRVIDEARFEHVPLSEVERKMLYFTEVHAPLPDIYEGNKEFERDYDSDEYEAKVAGLLKKARNRDRENSSVGAQQWEDAIDVLKSEDHYILVMAYSAFPEDRKTLVPTHHVRDYVIYISIGIAIVLVAIAVAVYSH